MSTLPFIKIGNHVIAVAHIISVRKSRDGSVYVMLPEENSLIFHDENANKLWEWASAMLRCSHITD